MENRLMLMHLFHWLSFFFPLGLVTAGSVQKLDERALARVERTTQHDAHFVMIFPPGCSDNVCVAMDRFWSELAAFVPLAVIWGVRCEEAPVLFLCAQVAQKGALVASWTGTEWQLYSGQRSLEALQAHVVGKIKAAMRPSTIDPPPSPPAVSSEACMLRAFRTSLQPAPQTGRPPVRPVSIQAVFTEFVRNASVELLGVTRAVAPGEIRWPSNLGIVSQFDVLPGVVTPAEVSRILHLVIHGLL